MSPLDPRIIEALNMIEHAQRDLSHAICLLVFADGKEAVQVARAVTTMAHRMVEMLAEKAPA